MKIKTEEKKSWFLDRFQKIVRQKKILFFALLLYTIASFFSGAYLNRSGSLNNALTLLQENTDLPMKFLRGLYSTPEHIAINVSYKNFQRLAYKREIALREKILFSSDDDFVPADIQYKDKSLKAKIRLKGDWIDHLEGDKWSFRIKFKDNETLFGMRQFSIQHPKTRNFIYEWIFHQALKREGVVALRYDFITVSLNGKNLGVYALEEHFDKQLIEKNNRQEGVIIKFNEDTLFADRKAFYPEFSLSPTGLQSEYASNIDAFKMNRIRQDSALSKQFSAAVSLLELFRTKQLPTHKVFDTEKLARFLVITEVFGATRLLHDESWHNFRFYYNPITSLLEPVGFEGLPGNNIQRILGANRSFRDVANHYYDILFSDPVFLEKYLKTLQRISKREYLNIFFEQVDNELQEKLAILYKEFPYYRFSKSVFYQNQNYIQKTLNPARGLHVFFENSSTDVIALELGNIQSLPITVLDAVYEDFVVLQSTQKVVLSPKIPGELVEYQKVFFQLPKDFVWTDDKISKVKVRYRILGIDEKREESVFSWPRIDMSFTKNDFMRRVPNVQEFDFLTVDEKNKKIVIKRGNWVLGKDLIIPEGYVVAAEVGTKINLKDSSVILSYSPLEFAGERDNPITLFSSDGTGQGIVVINASGISKINYVVFDNLSNPARGSWELTGAVTFYQSPVVILNSQFIKTRSEDSLNIIRSKFDVSESLFKNALSDGIDVDFGTGEIINSSFVNSGNDGIDISGSRVTVQNVSIDGAGDKGISVGERSSVTIDNLNVQSSHVAVASKDLSEVVIQGGIISNSDYGFAVYRKKKEFGPAKIYVKDISIKEVINSYLVENGSALYFDDEEIPGKDQGVFKLLYGE